MRHAITPARLAAVAIVAGVLLAVAVGLLLVSAGGHFMVARTAALDGRAALAAQNVAGAGAALTKAERSFGVAQRRLHNPAVRVLDLLPVVRQNLMAARAAAQAGGLVTAVGAEFTELLGDESGGAAALAPSGGRIPVEGLRDAAEPAARAAAAVRQAATLVAQADSPWLVGPVADGLREFRGQLTLANGLTTAAASLTQQLPAFLGADGPKRYFFGAGNPAELRGAGGFIGAYAILTVVDGGLSFGEFAPIHDLESLPLERVDPPHPDYAARYDRYGGAAFWLNINMTPDFPSAATAIERLYEATTGDRVDGTIVVTPAALAALLEVTGPADVPGIGRVAADDIVALMANEAFAEFDDHDERKRALGAVAAGVFTRFLDGGFGDPLAAGQAVARAATAGDLLLHAAEPPVQQALETAGVAGQLAVPPGEDLLAVVGNNAAANKADFYTDRTVAYRAGLLPDGGVGGRATVTLRNDAPTAGPPSHVIGPSPQTEGLEAGDNKTILGVYCGVGCTLRSFRRDGETALTYREQELGHPVYGTSFTLASGESTELQYRWSVPGAWTPDRHGGVYRLTVRDQATIRPTAFDLTVTIPEGWEAAGTTHEMVQDGRELRWSGELLNTEVFEIRLQRPMAVAAAEQIRTWATRPLLVSGAED